MSIKNANRKGMGTAGLTAGDSVPLADLIRREAAEVAALAAVVTHLVALEVISPEALARVRFCRQALEAAGVELVRRHTSTKSDNDAQALLRRRVQGAGGGT